MKLEIKELLGKCKQIIKDFKSKNDEQEKVENNFQMYVGGLIKK